jgi:hypothetical protein
MKKKILFLLPVFVAFIMSGCLKDKLTRTYTFFVPVYKEKSAVYADIKSTAPRNIESPGKLFMLGNYIFLNEVDKGIHVIDNSDPSRPVIKSFIPVPGNIDIAVKGNTLYADLYSDLIVLDIADPLHARFVKYIPHVFPERMYGNGFIGDTSRIVVDWIKKDTTVAYQKPCASCIYTLFVNNGVVASGGAASAPVGIAGSMARFSLVNDYLYTVNTQTLSSFNITDANNPLRTSSRQVGWNIETIYPFHNKLFIGSSNGMFIYDLANPAMPSPQGQFQHARSCDPVIADNDYAYVTLRSGNTCGGFNNQLDVINIANLQSPVLAKSYLLTNPHGLTKDNNVLFVCDGKDGLKVYDASNPLSLLLLKNITGIETYDAIAWNNNLLVVAKDGLYQYDYSNPAGMVQKSKLGVNH